MSWIRTTVKTVHLFVLLLVCGLAFYNLSARSEQSAPVPDKKNDNVGALTVVQNEDNEEDGVVTAETTDNEITIEDPDPFIPTNEWKKVKPGQGIPKGLHVRMNIQTGEMEARLLQDEDKPDQDTQTDNTAEHGTTKVGDQTYTLDELKKAVKAMKPEKVRPVDMEELQKENNFRSYEELKKDFEALNAAIKTDSEVVTELVEQFRGASPAEEDVTGLLTQLEYYLHQIDNAVLFCDLGAMPMLLRCLNNSKEAVRSEAALTLGSALQSNPKVQIAAIENGAMQELLRILAIDSSMAVCKRAMYALSTMMRHFPFAQKRFLELGGLSVLAKLFENKAAHNLQLRAVTLLSDLVKEKSLHTEHSNLDDSTQKERLRQYQEVALQEAMVETGWCQLIPTLLALPDHDSREKVMVAMETVLPSCLPDFQEAVPALRSLQDDYRTLKEEEELEEGDGYFRGLLSLAQELSRKLTAKDEL